MKLWDCHTHSVCSFDGVVPLAVMAQAAKDQGLMGLYVTDHCDFVAPDGSPCFSFAWEPVEEQLREARSRFGQELFIGKGLELGEPWEDPALADSIYHRPGVDMVLGSCHNMPLALGGTDYYEIHFTDEKSCYDALDVYFASMEMLSEMDCFDVLAHVIYPYRYTNHRDGNRATLERYWDLLIRVLRRVMDRGGSLELNTCRGTTVEDWRQVLTLYRDLGGTQVTLGSDAHEPRHIGLGLAEGAALLRELGFPGVTLYHGHKPTLLGWDTIL